MFYRNGTCITKFPITTQSGHKVNPINIMLTRITIFITLTLLSVSVRAITIDEYINHAERFAGTWVNVLCGNVEPVKDYNPDIMLERAFRQISIGKGIPKEWSIIEHKRATIAGKDDYYFIHFSANDQEHIFVFDLREYISSDHWCVRR